MLPHLSRVIFLLYSTVRKNIGSWKKEKDQYKIQYASLRPGLQEATIGIDSGSTTTKIVVLDNNHRILYSYYHDNNGNPIKTVENGLQKLYEECRRRGTTLRIKGGCSTGYGEDLIKAAFHMDAGIIETIAHYAAAKHISKEVSFNPGYWRAGYESHLCERRSNQQNRNQ